MSVEDCPIFIVGVHRSGTTLLRYMLNSSPRIYIPPESDFWPRFFGQDPQGPLSPKRVAQILDLILTRYRFTSEWQGEPPRAEALLWAMSSPDGRGDPAPTGWGGAAPTGRGDPAPTVARSPDAVPGQSPDAVPGQSPDAVPGQSPEAVSGALFLERLYRTYARQYGAVRWGDKTPIYASYMDLMDRLFPEAQFIHIIRDGRDVALSMLDKWGEREIHVDIFFTARNWVRRIRHARTSGARLGPDRYYEMRYESLVQDPEAEVQALCCFLGEPYYPAMAQPHLLGRQQIKPGSWEEPIRQPPTTARIGRWRQEMSPADQRLFGRVAGPMLAELGYEVVDLGPMPAGEVARFCALAAKYATLQAGRRVLQALGIMPPI